MFKTEFENLRRTCPLIQNITNYVTVNDCANMVLACGASPIMADDAAEVEDCLLYTSPSPRDGATSRMPSSA